MTEETPLISAERTLVPSSLRPAIEKVKDNPNDSKGTINCQVCGHVITFSTAERHKIVRCPECLEATPIEGPPDDKQYVRCTCNCLLVCNATAARVGCPRPDCQNIILISGDDVVSGYRSNNIGHRAMNYGGTPFTPQSLRLTCGNCNSPFTVSAPSQPSRGIFNIIASRVPGVNHSVSISACCPHCRKVTSVGPAYARVRWVTYTILAIIALIIAIIVTSTTSEAASANKALYLLWSVLYLIFLILALQAVNFMLMHVSSVSVPTLPI